MISTEWFLSANPSSSHFLCSTDLPMNCSCCQEKSALMWALYKLQSFRNIHVLYCASSMGCWPAAWAPIRSTSSPFLWPSCSLCCFSLIFASSSRNHGEEIPSVSTWSWTFRQWSAVKDLPLGALERAHGIPTAMGAAWAHLNFLQCLWEGVQKWYSALFENVDPFHKGNITLRVRNIAY